MSYGDQSEPNSSRQMTYQIRIGSRLDPTWADWFPGLSVAPQVNGDTLLTGPVADQAALHGLLKKVRDLGVPLVSVNPVKPAATPHSYAQGEEDADM